MSVVDCSYHVGLGFLPAALAIDDPERPGLRRAGPRSRAPYGAERVELHFPRARDLAGEGTSNMGLVTAGVDIVDLSGLGDVQSVCADVARRGRIDETQAASLRAGLDGAVLPAAGGGSFRVQYIAEEGLIMRTAGPNGRSMALPRSEGMNGHGAATSVHIDQDVYGTPLAQIMDGRAPSLFVHDSPDGSCHEAPMFLVNIWIPLRQVVQPLVLADGRSLDRRSHQLRYGLATGEFLERDDDLAINDIWLLLFDEGQAWYLKSDMDHRSAWIFNTLSTAHGAGTLPGEDIAEACSLALEAAEAAVEQQDSVALLALLEPVRAFDVPADAPPMLQGAIATMLACIEDACVDPSGVCGPRAAQWAAASNGARRSVVRMSLELRAVVVPAA
jgi:hypothetical protein